MLLTLHSRRSSANGCGSSLAGWPGRAPLWERANNPPPRRQEALPRILPVSQEEIKGWSATIATPGKEKCVLDSQAFEER